MTAESGTSLPTTTARRRSDVAVRLVRRLVEELNGNGNGIDRLYHRDHVDHDPRWEAGQPASDFWNDLRRGFPDLEVTVDVVLADNDRVMAFLNWRGHQTGPFGAAAATGAELNLSTSELFRVETGRIIEHWAVVDYSILRSFGMLPVRAPGPASGVLSGPHSAVEVANADTVLGAYRTVMSEHRLDQAQTYYQRDYLHHNAQMPIVPNGVAAFVAYFEGNFAAFPDLSVTVDHILAADDRVMVFATWRGHFTGVSRGRVPTGKRLTMRTSDLFRLVGGQVAEHWEVVDYSGLENVGMVVRAPSGPPRPAPPGLSPPR